MSESSELNYLIAQYENNNLTSKFYSEHIDVDELNEILSLMKCPEVADTGSSLFIAAYYMILKLSNRVEELEKAINSGESNDIHSTTG